MPFQNLFRNFFKPAPRRFAFTFICQEGELELKAMLLAASLKKFLRGGHELIAGIPAPAEIWGAPPAETLAFFERLGVRTEEIVNEVGPGCAHANKISCLKIPVDADKRVFMDSDMLCMREFRDEPRFAAEIHLKPADLQAFRINGGDWERVYAAVGIAMPAERFAATFSGEEGPPYFNSGFIMLESGIPLADAWRDCALLLNKADATLKMPEWSDQTALAVAVRKLKLQYDLLEERYNFPAHLRALDENALPIFCHYHFPSVVKREPRLAAMVRELATEHPEIAAAMRRYEGWRDLS